ncbi:hypothetical protein [Clostridium weizhouense]|uniref:Uncharacterized protein n=1 Tax=Clostridium weizhouense TaxID=2859781 RepID=A0ABS7ALR0_9CLOT|nr:hypothetical protein [Clostridium weizhouense]MBW6408631.1 hypothetical protein [Clostridium weizhouense]
MKPDQKYMSKSYTDSKNTYDINFFPLRTDFNFNYDLSIATPLNNFNKSLFNNNIPFYFRNNTISNVNEPFNNKEYSELYPSETKNSELHSYYNELNTNNTITTNTTNNNAYDNNMLNNNLFSEDTTNNITKRVLTPDEILRNFDLDLDESMDLERSCSDNSVNKIYAKIAKENSAIINTLSSYNIPSPVSRLIIKRIIKLSLKYCNEE